MRKLNFYDYILIIEPHYCIFHKKIPFHEVIKDPYSVHLYPLSVNLCVVIHSVEPTMFPLHKQSTGVR